MNRERQLLHAWLSFATQVSIDPMHEKLYKTTKELLAQPEQAELLEILEEIIADLKLRASLTEHPLVINISNGVYVKAITAIEKHRSIGGIR